MAAMRFMHLGRNVHFVGEVSAPSIRKGNALLIISGSGETPVSVNFARLAKSEGADVVTLTYKPAGSLARIADVVMPVPIKNNTTVRRQPVRAILPRPARQRRARAGRPAAGAHDTMLYRHTNLQ